MSNISITTLETFSPEIFLEIFRFLNGYDIYKAFYGVNHRLSTLVLTYGIKYIDLSEIRLNESRKILSDINFSQVNILKLSNKYNDEQIDQIFDNNHFSLSNFNHLHSLTLDSIGLFTFHSLTRQYLNLYNLKSLIIRFRSDLCQEKFRVIYRFILNDLCFRFKSLKLLDLSILNVNKSTIDYVSISNDPFLSSRKICSSLQYLSINNICNKDIESIFSNFPNLSKLNATIRLNISIFNYPLLINLISCTLKIFLFRFESFIYLLKQCPNLKQLILYIDPIDSDVLNSDQLENLIKNYLLKLKKFQIYMIIIDIPINIIQNSFKNQFWVERKTKFNIINEKTTIDGIFQAEIMIEFTNHNLAE